MNVDELLYERSLARAAKTMKPAEQFYRDAHYPDYSDEQWAEERESHTALFETMQQFSDQQNKELREQYPVKIYGWEISPETEPNALKAGSKFKAVNDGDVKSGESINELIEECAEETNDYFWKATDGYKAEIQRLTKEVGDSKVRLKQAVEFAGTKGGENTRLRELLDKRIKTMHERRNPLKTNTMKTKFYYFENHGDEDGNRMYSICYGDPEFYGEPESEIVGAEDTEDDAIEVCKMLNKILQLYSDQQNKELREQYPIKLHGWEISQETDPNALKAGIKFKAVCDGDVKSGESVNELIKEIAEETEDYLG